MTLSELLANEDFLDGKKLAYTCTKPPFGWGDWMRFDRGVLDYSAKPTGPWITAVISVWHLRADWRLVEKEET